MRRALLTRERTARAETHPQRAQRWTRPQQQLFDSPYRMTIWWGANGIGKSVGVAELATRALAGELYWQTPGPHTVILAGKTWVQLGSTLRYMWAGRLSRWLRPGVRYESGGMKGQRLAVYDIVAGPGAGGELRCGTFRAENLAGPRADVVITDEPLPEAVYNELWPRLLGRDGRMYQTFTPTFGTAAKVQYIWDLVDDEKVPWAGEIHTPLTLDAVTPRGGLLEVPWMTQREIDEFRAGLSGAEVDMRMGLSRQPRRDAAWFQAWGPHLISADPPPAGARLGVGIDHGSRPGAERVVLIAVVGLGIHARVWVLSEIKATGRTETRGDARAILRMLDDLHIRLEDVDVWVGDRAHSGDRFGGRKSNGALLQAIGTELGLDTTKRGWRQKLPGNLRYMAVPRKYDQSVWEGAEVLHRLMVGEDPRLRVHPRCVHLIDDIREWKGSTIDQHKDGLDAWRYITVPMIEGRRR